MFLNCQCHDALNKSTVNKKQFTKKGDLPASFFDVMISSRLFHNELDSVFKTISLDGHEIDAAGEAADVE